jgi:NitT/TauT family transport system permease protein
MVPNEVRTGSRTGQRSTWAWTCAIAEDADGKVVSRVSTLIGLGYKGMVYGTFVTLMPQPRNRLARAGWILAPWLAILVLWYAVRASGLVNPALVPAPHAVFTRFLELAQGRLGLDVWMSTQRVFVGVTLGVAVAVPVGFAIGWYRGVRTFVDPLINFFRALPPIALIPLVIVYFGIGEPAKIVILFYASFFAGVIVMYEGIAQISPLYVRVSRTLGATDAEIFRKVIVPLTVPHLLTALRVALGVAWATLVASELIAAQQGLGALIQNASAFFQLDIIYVGIICIGVIALAMDLALRAIARRLVSWQERIA